MVSITAYFDLKFKSRKEVGYYLFQIILVLTKYSTMRKLILFFLLKVFNIKNVDFRFDILSKLILKYIDKKNTTATEVRLLLNL